MVDFSKVARYLSERKQEILASAGEAIARAHLPHYAHGGAAAGMDRLDALYALVLRCAEERHLAPMTDHAAHVAAERHAAGIGLGEVQTAVNVLEEAIWRAVMTELPADQQAEALGVVGTILGAFKDRLACTYVSLAAKKSTRTLDLGELFHGPGEGDATSI